MDLPLSRSFGPRETPAWFRDWATAAGSPDLNLVVPSGCFLRPTAIALLAAGIAWRQSEGLTTTMRWEPGSEDTHRYLQRIDFFRSLGVTSREAFERHDPTGRFVPLQRITDERTAHDLAERSVACLDAGLLAGPRSPLRMARFVFEELGVNIVQHSGAAQTFDGDLWGLSRTGHVWIVDTESNEAAARQVWSREPGAQWPMQGVTTFSGIAQDPDTLYSELSTIDLHHGEHSAALPWQVIHVRGLDIGDVSQPRSTKHRAERISRSPGPGSLASTRSVGYRRVALRGAHGDGLS